MLDAVKGLLGGAADEHAFPYRCQSCDSVFEDASPSASKVSCPDCAATRALSLPSSAA
ncbi:MAG: hypothetical protein ABEJ90_01885 [Halobacterium sp.]